MKSGIRPRTIIGFFILVAILYLGIFYGIEYWRQWKGPWEVHFQSDAEGNPSLVIYQPKLHISSVEIVFPGEKVPQTNLAAVVRFDRPLKPIPFGRILYEDLTTLPGVVTLDLFGHEVEFLPRVLIVNKQEIPWQSEAVLELSPTNKPARPPQPPKGWQ